MILYYSVHIIYSVNMKMCQSIKIISFCITHGCCRFKTALQPAGERICIESPRNAVPSPEHAGLKIIEALHTPKGKKCSFSVKKIQKKCASLDDKILLQKYANHYHHHVLTFLTAI